MPGYLLTHCLSSLLVCVPSLLTFVWILEPRGGSAPSWTEGRTAGRAVAPHTPYCAIRLYCSAWLAGHGIFAAPAF
jgi:hypothetical protein